MNDKIIKELLKDENNYKYYNLFKDYDLKELIIMLKKVLNNNIHCFNYNEEEISNIDKLSHYKKYELTNKLNGSDRIYILNYIISKKLNN